MRGCSVTVSQRKGVLAVGGFDNTALIALGAAILAPDTEDRSTPYRLLYFGIPTAFAIRSVAGLGFSVLRLFGVPVGCSFRFLTLKAGALFSALLNCHFRTSGASGVSALVSRSQAERLAQHSLSKSIKLMLCEKWSAASAYSMRRTPDAPHMFRSLFTLFVESGRRHSAPAMNQRAE